MADSDMLRNLTAAAVQMAILAALAEVLLRALPVAAAGFRYAYWRLVLVAALVLPWLLRATPQPAIPTAPNETVVPVSTFLPITDVAAAVAPGGTSWLAVLPWLLAAGTGLRVLWLAAGIARLRAARRRGEAVLDSEYDEIQQRLGTHAVIRAVPGLGQPVTFGLWRPVILLPMSLASAGETIRRAAVAHELVHVQRRDWLFVLVEELLRAVFWFHPAIWWMTARVRLTREEFTDHLAVLATGSRRSYIDALLAFADAPHVAPAPAFIRRAHLFHRIVLLTKEPAMSSRRIVTSGVVLAVLLGAGGWYAGETFPVRAPLAVVAASTDARPAPQAPAPATEMHIPTPENPIPRRLFATPIHYPLELAGTGFESALSIRVVLNAAGSVESAIAGARAVASPGRQPAFAESEAMERFGAAAVEAISRWQYAPPAQAPLAFYLAVVFKPGADAVATQSDRPQAVHAGPDGARMATPAEAADMAARALARRAAQVRTGAQADGPFAPSGASAGAATPGPARPGSAQAEGARGRAAGAASGAGARGFVDTVRVPADPAAERAAAAQRDAARTVRPGGGPVRVGGAISAPTAIRKVAPVYPEEARAARVQGVVILEAIINAQGRVENVRILRSIPLLDQAAIDAVRQWEYTPTLLNGLPVGVVMTTTVQFTLDSATTPNSQPPTPN